MRNFFLSLFLSVIGLATAQAQLYIVNGDATSQGNCYRLTRNLTFEGGSVWYADKINLKNSFDLYFDIFLGCQDAAGADGIAFVLQPISTNIGSAGGGLGYAGVIPSVAVEIDTWQNGDANDPVYDHVGVQLNGNVGHGVGGGSLAGPVPALPGLGNIEDCAWHKMRVTWEADINKLTAYIDCNPTISYTADIINTVFGGDSLVFWGFTGATGGSWNEQRFCLDYISFTESQQDTAICEGQSVPLSVGSGDVFAWSPALGLDDSTATNPIATPSVTTTYTVTITDVCGQTRFDTVTVFVQEDTVLDVLPDQFYQCGPGDPIVLTAANLPFSQYLWSTGATTQSTTVIQPGLYSVTVSNFCTTFSDQVQVLPRPAISFIKNDVSCNGGANGTATFTNSGTGPFTATWFSLSAGSAIKSQTLASPVSNVNNLSPGFYALTTLNGNGCRDTVTFQILQPSPLQIQVAATQNLTCFGDNSGSITLGSTGGTGAKSYSLNNGSAQASPTFSNLPAGTYVVRVSDQNGCQSTQTVTLTQPPQIILQPVTVQGADCFGAATGAVTVSASLGIIPYQYNINGGGFQPSATFSGLIAGSYQIQAMDNNGCIGQQIVQISQPTALLASAAVANVDCAGDATGAISIAGSGGTPGYAYAFQGGVFGNQTAFPNLAAGTYSLSIRDDSACVTTISATINEPAALDLQIATTDVACFGDATGFLVLQGLNGWGGYQYSLDGGPFSFSDTISNLPIGSYQITVRDDSLCTATQQVSINEPPLLDIFVNDRIDVDCSGNNTGILAVSGIGGTQPYLFTRNGTSYQTSGTFTNLFAGIYTLQVQDANGCEAEVDTFLATPTGLSGGVDSLVDVACFGDSTGFIHLIAFGGTSPYRYALNGDTITGNSFANLPFMTDTLVLVDANGCIVPVPFTIDEPPLLQGILTRTRDLACFQTPNGEIRLAGAGGTGVYTYSIGNGFQTSRQFNQLLAGTYMGVIQDSNGCLDTLSVILAEPSQLLLDSVLVQDVKCFGQQDGLIQVQAAGGSGAWVYQLDTLGWAALNTFSGLTGGQYLVQVRDDSLCLDSLVFEISEPDSLVLSPLLQRDLACFGGNTGAVTVMASGGRMPWRYRINGGLLQQDSLFSGLLAGNYLVEVLDDSLCSDTVSFVLNQPEPLTLNLVSLQDVRCFGERNGEIVVTASGGIAPYQYSLSGASPQLDSSFLGVGPGTYQVILRDDSACNTVLPDLTIAEPALLEAISDFVEVRCFGESNGEVFVNIRGGNGGYSTEWFTDPLQVGNTAVGLFAGVYGFRVEDSLGCETAGEVVLTEPDLLVMSIDSIREAYCDWENGGAWLSATGGTGEYSYQWEGLSGLNSPSAVDVLGLDYLVVLSDVRGCNDSILVSIPNTPPADTRFTTIPDPSSPILESVGPIQFLNLTTGAVTYLWEFGDGALSDDENPTHQYELPGEYQVRLTGWNAFFVCPTIFDLTLTIIADGQLYYPNAFTPNADGANDVFFVKGEGIVELEVLIFDRWGRLITRWTDLSQGWDGRIPGAGLAAEGVYTFAVKAKTNAGADINYGGTVTLIR
ncbi:MAG: gliding motility-associated C-terminal domain-containing protein [Bacteroidia bacterium]|nr:gliding motility-associated C-terminal domain-containing protein [Bacteroidia bacterium]